MMLYKNTRSMVRSPDGDTDFFDIQAGVLQGDTLAPFLFILALDYVLRTSVDKHKELGLTLKPARSRRYPAEKITDADYADDLTLLADKIAHAEKLLHSLETAAAGIGLYVNTKKTEYMCHRQDGQIKARNDTPIKKVDEAIYLGSNIALTEKDVQTRIAKAWGALNGLDVIWKSTLPEDMKRNFFRATVESVLLYGSTTWTLTKKLNDLLDGTYTRMLRAILNISWKQHPTKTRLYGHLPPISTTVRQRRLMFAGHCWRSKDEIASDLLLWDPTHGDTKRGRPHKTYVDQLLQDTDCEPDELRPTMEDRDLWRRVILVRANSPPG